MLYYRVQDGTTLQIQSNSGSLYGDIDALTIPTVSDGDYHTWVSTVKVDSGTAYWDLQLDGAQLLFTGASGSPVLDGDQYSFKTGPNDFSGDPYIGLGELNTQETWDFEFDYVHWQNVPEPASLALLAAGLCCLLAWRRFAA